MKIKIISDYRKLMPLGIPFDAAIELTASVIVDANVTQSYNMRSAQVGVWTIQEKLGKVTLFTEVK